MSTKKKRCILTGTRAEYGLFRPLMAELKKFRKVELQLIATGMHLSPEYGLTYRDIEKDGFRIDVKVEMLLSSDTGVGIAKSTGLGISGIAEALDRLAPDILILLGDRFETLSAAVAATMLRVPIAHIHGGEITEGVIDEQMRHAITKMSHLHFTSTDEYRRRVIQMGEQPKRVVNTGSLGIDNIKGTRLLDSPALEKKLGIRLRKNNILVTYHPESLPPADIERQMNEVIGALDTLDDTLIIFTMPNADAGGRIISEMIEEYVCLRDNVISFASMGQLLYLSSMKHMDMVVGNSSSGIIEAPSFGIPTVNIGNRQKGRIRAASVIDCKPTKRSVLGAIGKARSVQFRAKCRKEKNPYGKGGAAGRIASAVIRTLDSDGLMPKSFYDINGR